MRPAQTIAISLLSLTFSPCVVWGASITYNLQSYLIPQGFNTVTGTITTDGNIGNITASDISSWSYTIRSPLGFIVDQEAGTSTSVTVDGLNATSTTLTLPSGPARTDLQFFPSPFPTNLSYIRTNIDVYAAETASGSIIWVNQVPVPPGLILGGDPWVIAVAASTVPEPGSLTLALLGGACLAVVQWTRRRRRHAAIPQAILPAHS
jgi:hypothetical protein